ncbi:LLM class flavin-dependent oxidoreductase [Streptomyces sp. NPDC048332]|uniref:LLM class flavin-dependent oxidoreductase n=1 Tax=Streptomyces sp. NPDC048332 TaxID=3154619 RepID=UPI00343B45A6
MAVNAGESVSFDGPHRQRVLRDVTVFPDPEEPLRIWLGTGGSPESVHRAVEFGLPLFLGLLGGTPEHVPSTAAPTAPPGHRPATPPNRPISPSPSMNSWPTPATRRAPPSWSTSTA